MYLLWVSALVRLPEHSRFGGINGKMNSRFEATGIARKRLNFLTFTMADGRRTGKIEKIPASTGITGNGLCAGGCPQS